jgi:hypothetical protein
VTQCFHLECGCQPPQSDLMESDLYSKYTNDMRVEHLLLLKQIKDMASLKTNQSQSIEEDSISWVPDDKLLENLVFQQIRNLVNNPEEPGSVWNSVLVKIIVSLLGLILVSKFIEFMTKKGKVSEGSIKVEENWR